MGFFNESAATTLQYFSFPLEVIGLTLALIELRFPATAARLTRLIEGLAAPVDKLRRASDTTEKDAAIEHALAYLLTRVLTAGFVLLFGYFLLRIVVTVLSGEATAGWFIGLAITALVASTVTAVSLTLLSIVVYFTVIGGFDFVTRFVAGRAIGSLGLLIAGIGAMFEGYQFLQQIIDN